MAATVALKEGRAQRAVHRPRRRRFWAAAAASAGRSRRRTSIALAANGLRYGNMHTTALCSPTRSCMLTGRNHHSNAHVVHHRGRDRLSRATTARCRSRTAFSPRCYCRTATTPSAIGKWHLTPAEEIIGGGPVRPLAARPRLRTLLRLPRRRDTSVLSRSSCHDNHHGGPAEKTPEEGYHLTEDLADKAIRYIADAKQVAPDKPFFIYFCPGRRSRAASRAEGMGRPVQGQI